MNTKLLKHLPSGSNILEYFFDTSTSRWVIWYSYNGKDYKTKIKENKRGY